MPRFFIDDRPQGELYTLTGENAHHAGRVLRLRPGETLTLCDGAGTDFDCTVEQAEKDEVVCRVQAVHPSETEPRQDMTLFMALPKGDKMEFVIQKSVELGVRKIVPFLSKNCVSRPDKTDKKVERWRKIAAEAAKQCGRGYLPVVTAVESAEKAFAMASDSGTALFFYEHETRGVLRGRRPASARAGDPFHPAAVGVRRPGGRLRARRGAGGTECRSFERFARHAHPAV